MKPTYNRAVLAARGILQRTAKENGVTFEEVYEGFQNAIRCGLASTEPEAVRFWNNVKRQAGKEVPSPEDMLVYISAMSNKTPETCYPAMNFAGAVFH